MNHNLLKSLYLTLIFILVTAITYGQNTIDISARFDMEQKIIHIEQKIRYQNTSNDTLSTVYLNDWANSYSTKTTPLAHRFTQEFSTRFHFAKSEDRGYTSIISIKDKDANELSHTRIKDRQDIISLQPAQPLLPGEFYDITLYYNVKIPSDAYTSYGITADGEMNLRYWYITPAVYDGQWHYYSNKNLDDLYVPKADISLNVEIPLNFAIYTELDIKNIKQNGNRQTFSFYGKDRVDTKLFIVKYPKFKYVQTDNFTVITNIEDNGVTSADKAIITDKITAFISNHLGNYPHNYLLLSNTEYKKDPLYGLNQLPDFIRPFPNTLQYELKLLKTALNNYLDNVLLLNPRNDYWLKEGIQIYYLMKYVEENYPDLKLLGTLANVWGIRSFHAAEVNFNEQYNLFYMQMARTNRDQPLTVPKDSLLKFNANIANKYKAGIGLKYLNDYINGNILEQTVKEFLDTKKLQATSSKDFETLLKQQTDKDIDWFFTDYISTRKKIDFRIKNVRSTEDSITLTIKNKRDNNMPVSLFTLHNDSVLSKIWIEDINDKKTITIPHDGANKLVLNYDNSVPEFNLRDNWKSLKGFFFNNKPLQIRLFQDIENPNYNQVFLMPLVEFNNIYDGVSLGLKAYNKTLLRRRLNYRLAPQYGTKSKTLTGSSVVTYIQDIENHNLHSIIYGLGASYKSFAPDAFVTVVTPSISFNFRQDKHFRSNKSSYLNFRYLDIFRNVDKNPLIPLDEPNYGVFNIRYVNSDNGIVNFSKWHYDFQAAKRFGKLSVNYEYRKLYESNRQFQIRLFAGSFIYNKTDPNSDYFSFALDRPTDYLFDYNYLGRSEASGIFSQQIIIAEGGFKSKLDTPYANQWMTTVNTSTTIWRFIEAYGDVGLVKNKFNNAAVVYDSGIRLNLVTDYFEVFFPVYSNLGWEIGRDNYDQKIRFMFTVDPQTLFGLFRRKWY